MTGALLPVIDPIVAHAAAGFIAAVLLTGAWSKQSDPALFLAALDNYRLVPARALAFTARLLPLLETTAGALLLVPAARPVAAALALALLALVTLAVAINLRRGRRIDCGCGGTDALPLSWALVARNLLLCAASVTAAAPTVPRASVWLDAAAAVLAALFALGLYATANQLIANHLHLPSLSDPS